MNIRPVTAADAVQIAAIYSHYVENHTATFEEQAVDGDEMGRRIARLAASHPWLVGHEGDCILGYAFAAPWRTRSAYRFTVESSIYVAPHLQRRGFGTRLYGALMDELRARGIHSVIGGVTLPNEASVALHERLGFAPVGVFRSVGWKFGRWMDVSYWQLALADGAPGTGVNAPPQEGS